MLCTTTHPRQAIPDDDNKKKQQILSSHNCIFVFCIQLIRKKRYLFYKRKATIYTTIQSLLAPVVCRDLLMPRANSNEIP